MDSPIPGKKPFRKKSMVSMHAKLQRSGHTSLERLAALTWANEFLVHADRS